MGKYGAVIGWHTRRFFALPQTDLTGCEEFLANNSTVFTPVHLNTECCRMTVKMIGVDIVPSLICPPP